MAPLFMDSLIILANRHGILFIPATPPGCYAWWSCTCWLGHACHAKPQGLNQQCSGMQALNTGGDGAWPPLSRDLPHHACKLHPLMMTCMPCQAAGVESAMQWHAGFKRRWRCGHGPSLRGLPHHPCAACSRHAIHRGGEVSGQVQGPGLAGRRAGGLLGPVISAIALPPPDRRERPQWDRV